MSYTIVQFLSDLWKNWDIQMFVMLSLSLQLFLIWFASLRKRVASQILHVSVWLAYLLADWAAIFAIGLIHYKGCKEHAIDGTLYSFWAPFLVVHLGGPDTITALTMEDNELWRRHLLQFIAQAVATCNILYHNPPPDPLLWLPVVLIFVCGLIKYGERVWALYCASLDKFRRSNLRDPDPGPNYAMFMEQYALKVEDGFRTRIETIKEPELEQDLPNNFEVRQKGQLPGVQVVKDAYRFYQRFKGLIVDFEYSFRDLEKSVQYFISLETDDAFRVVETELNFLYDAFYTKSIILHRRAAYFVRCCCLCFDLLSFGVFFFWEKRGHNSNKLHIANRDVRISYTLLLGAAALDFISILVLVFSNWTVAFLVKDYEQHKDRSLFNDVTNKVLNFGSRWLSAYPEAPQASQLIFRRWSNSVSRFSLLGYYLNQQPSKFNKCFDLLGIKLFIDDLRYVDTYKMPESMKKIIFQELKKKSEQVDDPEMAKNLCHARGDWVLNSYVGNNKVLELNNWIKEVEYDESLLLWHIATELCYNKCKLFYDEQRTISKVLSDYMVYLLVMKPMMISNVAGISDLRLRDTEAEALRYIQGFILETQDRSRLPPLNLLCHSMMSILIRDDVRPGDVKGTRSKSVLFEACRLADKLMNLPKEVNSWEVMSRVWVELLCYAASHCRPTSHVQQVSRGGELISVVWFLMTHLGVGKNFHVDDGPTRTKLFVDE